MIALALTIAVPGQARHKNFKVSVYVRAYEVDKMKDTQWLESTWKTISDQLDVDKIYLETHRDLLIVDDFGMKALDGQQLLDFLEIIEDRHGRKATIIVSQLPVADWYDVLQGNTTAADAILDRIVHTAIRFELKGESMRK